MATNYTTQEVADLEAALATGALRVSHNGVTTEFRSRDDMIKQIRMMKIALGLDPGDVVRDPRIRRIRFLGSKGL